MFQGAFDSRSFIVSGMVRAESPSAYQLRTVAGGWPSATAAALIDP